MDITPAETTTIKQDSDTKPFEVMMFEFFQGENSDGEKNFETHRPTQSESRLKLDGFHSGNAQDSIGGFGQKR